MSHSAAQVGCSARGPCFSPVRLAILAGSAASIAPGAHAAVTSPDFPTRVSDPSWSYVQPAGATSTFIFPTGASILVRSISLGLSQFCAAPAEQIGATASCTQLNPMSLEIADATGLYSLTFTQTVTGSLFRVIDRGRPRPRDMTMDIDLDQVDIPGLPPPVLIRESPTRASTGSMRFTEAPDGSFRIESFFDIFFELSPDQGQTWLPAQSATRLELIPAPSVAGLGFMGLLQAARRRRRA